MATDKGDVYWAKWCYGLCQMAKVAVNPNTEYARVTDMKRTSIASMAARMRRRGFLVPIEEGLHLTAKAEGILQSINFKGFEGAVAFDLEVRVKTKEEALAEVWDVISQLEHWDPRSGEPFRLDFTRHKKQTMQQED